MANDFGTGKSVFILGIVAGCFAILWPNIFYPMLMGSYPSNKIQEQTGTGGCCDVIFDNDVNAIKLMTELCENILIRHPDYEKLFLLAFEQKKLNKDIIERCQKTVIEKCNVDITEFLNEKVRLGKSYKQMLDEIRSLNSSICLKQSFGISFQEIGLPRTVRIWGLNKPKHIRQERPPHLRPEFLHPALREKGRAIPQSHVVPKIKQTQEGRPGPIPGIRPPMGGAGHVVPPPKTGGSTMGIVMPMYTIGIVVFFLYTVMRLILRKADDSSSYENFAPDPDFQRAVFSEPQIHTKSPTSEPSEEGKLGQRQSDARDLELDLLKKRLQETEMAMERIVAKMMSMPNNRHPEGLITLMKEKEEKEVEILGSEIDEEIDESGKGVVKVIGMEMTESCEKGAKWSRPPTPLSRPATPQNIYITGALPSQSKILVSDSHTETLPDEDNAVVLTGKVTLSLIGLESDNNEAEDESLKDSQNNKEEVEEDSSKADDEEECRTSVNIPNETEIGPQLTNIEHEIEDTKESGDSENEAYDVEYVDEEDIEYEEEEEEIEEECEEEEEEGGEPQGIENKIKSKEVIN